MSFDFRRSDRFVDFLPVTISVSGKNRENRIRDVIAARIVNISNHGACLLLPKVMLNSSFHIFHSTREDDMCCLNLHIPSSGEENTLEIETQPVWLNMVHMNDLKMFKMGVDFLVPLNQSQLKQINTMIRQAD